jgi:hypothetical protein
LDWQSKIGNPKSKIQTMTIQGSLQAMSLPNIVQTICLEHRQASLVLRHWLEEGSIFFDGGEIVHAAVGQLEGEKAVYHLLGWVDGTFHVHDDVPAPYQTVTRTWGYLLMEGLRLVDEGSSGFTDTQETKELSPVQIQDDETLESDLFVLLSRLEQMQDQISRKKQPTITLKMLTNMINELVTFSEVWLDVKENIDTLPRAIAKATDIYPEVGWLQVQRNTLSVPAVLELYDNLSKNPTGRRQMFSQITRGMLDVLGTYFSILMSRYHSADAAEMSKELCNVFLTDLTQAVEKIKF